MKRFAEDYLKQWLVAKDRKPLVLRGARQVGKSTLVRLFCKNNNIHLLELNLEKVKLKSLNTDHLILNEILDEIQLITNIKITNQTLIFFDEIQEQPKLLKFLRYFYEEAPNLRIIAAGSLLEIALKDSDFSFPVGRVEFYHLGPMTFMEFLEAQQLSLLIEKISMNDFSEFTINQAEKEFRKYIYIGGMPKAVSTYIEEKSLVSIRKIHDDILQAYYLDFPKYNSKINYSRLNRIFMACAGQVGKKIIYKRFDGESQSRDIRRVLELLNDSKVISFCMHSEGQSVPLAGQADPSISKLYMLDVGLLNSMLGLDLNSLDEELKNQFNSKGMVAEQFIFQHLQYWQGCLRAPQTFYWLKDKGVQKGAIDFLVELNQQIIPIEIKSTSPGHMKSLFYYSKEKSKKFAVRFSLDSFSIQNISHKIDGTKVELKLMTVPIWAVESLKKILKHNKDIYNVL